MKILFVADINSPIARNWIRYFVGPENEIEIVCCYPLLEPNWAGLRIHSVPLLYGSLFRFSTTQMSQAHTDGKPAPKRQQMTAHVLRTVNRTLGLQVLWKSYVAPVDARRKHKQLQRIADEFQPDLIHAMRILPEGYAAARLTGAPKIISLWGNDLTLYARQLPLGHYSARAALGSANGLHADCQRDLNLAQEFGYAAAGPTLLTPTAGGISRREVDPALVEVWRKRLSIPKHAPVVINPRGARSYVRVREFFQAIPRVLQQCPDVIFVNLSVQGNSLVERLVRELGIEQAVRCLPVLSQDDLAALFKLADVMVSPTVYDGTPNTLLEAMSQGTFPIVSDIASLREWIVPGENGLLIDPKDPNAIAGAILRALNDATLRARARTANEQIIRERADYDSCMQRANVFYRQIIESNAQS